MTEITIIIPAYKDAEGLEITLKSLCNQSIKKERYEIIVANDGGFKEISNICLQYQTKEVTILPNQGSYNARNEAIKIAKTEKLGFTDADIIVSKDWIKNGIEALDKSDYIVGPVSIVKKERMKVYEKYEYYTAFNMKRYFNEFKTGGAGNLFTKKSVFEEIGSFDSRLRSGGDIEFGSRVYKSGKYRQAYDENLLIFHPLRDYNDMINKVDRVSKGIVTISKISADTIPKRIKPSILKALRHILLPPNLFKTKYYLIKDKDWPIIFLFHWYLSILKGYYTIKYLIFKN